MPQGGAGKCGGNLMSSGNSKKKMSSKPRIIKMKMKATTSNDGHSDEHGGAHTVIRPSKETRALVMRAQRALLESERKEMVAARRGKKSSGQRLGGGDDVDAREARLQYLEQQQQAAAAAARASPRGARTGVTNQIVAAAEAEAGRARKVAYMLAHAGDAVCSEVMLMLDLLGHRLVERMAVEQAHQTLCTVLRNALEHVGDDPKYRTLRAQNDKMWARLLCHEEMLALLGAAGFEEQREEQQRADATSGESGAGEPESIVARGVPSFIESSFTSKVEYERWVQRRAPEGIAVAVDGADSPDAAAETEVEMQALHVALAEQLDGTLPPAPGVVESLLSRLQELAVTPSAGDVDSEDERSFELVHGASEEAIEELAAVLEAVTAWCFDP